MSGYVIPDVRASSNQKHEKYQGATVIDADTGYYTAPVATLDFASLYHLTVLFSPPFSLPSPSSVSSLPSLDIQAS